MRQIASRYVADCVAICGRLRRDMWQIASRYASDYVAICGKWHVFFRLSVFVYIYKCTRVKKNAYLCSRKPLTPIIRIMKRLITLMAAILLSEVSLLAMPAWKGMLKKKQSDGTVVAYYLQGDEWGHRTTTTDGLLLQEDELGDLRYMSFAQTGKKRAAQATEPPLAHNVGERTVEEKAYIEMNLDWLKASEMQPASYPERSRGPRRASKASDFQIGTFPTKGDAHGLIILAAFSDLDFKLSRDFHQRMMNEEGFSDYAGVAPEELGYTGSARDYFISQSNGLFQPTFDVVGPVKLNNSYSYYGRNGGFYNQDVNAEKMIVDACNMAHDELGVDFSQYDYDDDGKVDMVYVIYAGFGENAGGGASTVWPKKYNLTQAGYEVRLNGKLVDVFACSAELFGNEGEQTASIAQFCHEFGHVLGFADHYNTYDSRQYNLGSYDLMDYGAYNNDSRTPPAYNAFERMTVGWLTPEELDDVDEGVTLQNLNESNRAFRLSTQRNPNEFYLLENRQQQGWDEFIPGSGLMITHVDFDMSTWNSNEANYEENHKRFYLVCADDEPGYDILLEKESEKNDLFPYGVNDLFIDDSSPAAFTYTGEKLDKWVTNIKNEDGVVSFDFMQNHLKAPSFLTERDVTDEGFTAVWTNNDDRAETYNLRLTHKLREQDLKMPVREGFKGLPNGTKEQPGSVDYGQQLDEVMSVKGWTGEQIYSAGMMAMMGKAGIDGWLKSPSMNFATYDRDFAVLLKVSSATGKQPVLTVEANGLQAKHRLSSTPRMYLYPFSGVGLTNIDITIAVQKERAFIDSLIIIRGADAATYYPNAKVVNPSGEVASTEDGPFEQQYISAEQWTFNDIEDTEYALTDLQEGECYDWEVQALGHGMNSRWSDVHSLIVSSDYLPTSITQLPSPTTHHPSPNTAIYNIKGMRVSDLSQPGIYIMKTNGQTRKTIVN